MQQGHNIKLLTLVSIFFLPLTFVTSVFGMTNMPTAKHYGIFGIVVATVCIPFFVLIGSLNTNRGMRFWRSRTKALFKQIGAFFAWLAKGGRQEEQNLISTKSFESTTSMPETRSGSGTWRLGRRSSTKQNQETRTRVRAQSDVDEPIGRENERQRKVEDGPPSSGPMSPRLGQRPSLTVATEPASRLAEMWLDERDRKRRLRYRDEM